MRIWRYRREIHQERSLSDVHHFKLLPGMEKEKPLNEKIQSVAQRIYQYSICFHYGDLYPRITQDDIGHQARKSREDTVLYYSFGRQKGKDETFPINLPQDYVLDFYLPVRLEAGTLH